MGGRGASRTSLLACNALTGASDLATGTGEVGTDGGTATSGPLARRRCRSPKRRGRWYWSEPAIAPSLASCGTGSICLPSTSTWSPALSLVTEVSSPRQLADEDRLRDIRWRQLRLQLHAKRRLVLRQRDREQERAGMWEHADDLSRSRRSASGR